MNDTTLAALRRAYAEGWHAAQVLTAGISALEVGPHDPYVAFRLEGAAVCLVEGLAIVAAQIQREEASRGESLEDAAERREDGTGEEYDALSEGEEVGS
jgi:hypothetical protein